jgi:hypothetical protein
MQAMSSFIKKQTGFPGKYHYYPGRSTMGVFLAAFFTIVLIVATRLLPVHDHVGETRIPVKE